MNFQKPDWFVNAPRSDHFIVIFLFLFVVVASYNIGKNSDNSEFMRFESEDYGQSGKFSKSLISESICNGAFWEEELQNLGDVQADTSSSPPEVEDNRFHCQIELEHDAFDELESSNYRVTLEFSGVLNGHEHESVTLLAADQCAVFTDLVDPNVPENEEDESRYDLDQRKCLLQEDADEEIVIYNGSVSRGSWGLDVVMETEALESGEVSQEIRSLLNWIIPVLQKAEFELTE